MLPAQREGDLPGQRRGPRPGFQADERGHRPDSRHRLRPGRFHPVPPDARQQLPHIVHAHPGVEAIRTARTQPFRRLGAATMAAWGQNRRIARGNAAVCSAAVTSTNTASALNDSMTPAIPSTPGRDSKLATTSNPLSSSRVERISAANLSSGTIDTGRMSPWPAVSCLAVALPFRESLKNRQYLLFSMD